MKNISTFVKRMSFIIGFTLMWMEIAESQFSSSMINTSGLIDVYFSHNFENPDSHVNKFRNFDIQENQFTLSLAEIVIQKAVSTTSPIGFRMDFNYGTTNDLVQPACTSTLTIVQQAYVTALLPFGNGLTVDLGKFVTHMGNEVIESKDNWNYSRSFLFSFAIPYYHTGMRICYPVVSNFTASLHVVNGWNSDIDNNKSKSFGATLNYSPTTTTGIIFNGIWGHENLTSIEYGARNVYDLIISQSIGDKFSVAANADYGEAGTSAGLQMWKGLALYSRYTIDTLSAITLRGEVYNDPTGYSTGVIGTIKEATLTLEHKFFNQMLVRGELRDDFSTTHCFDKKANVGTEKSQLTFLVGVVVAF